MDWKLIGDHEPGDYSSPEADLTREFPILSLMSGMPSVLTCLKREPLGAVESGRIR